MVMCRNASGRRRSIQLLQHLTFHSLKGLVQARFRFRGRFSVCRGVSGVQGYPTSILWFPDLPCLAGEGLGAEHRGLGSTSSSKLSSHALMSPCLLHWRASNLPWKWQHFNVCWGARPLTPLVADSLEVNFPVAHPLFFLFSVKQPIWTLPELYKSGQCVTAVRKMSLGTLCSCTMNNVIPTMEVTQGDKGLAWCLPGQQVEFGSSQKEEGPSII